MPKSPILTCGILVSLLLAGCSGGDGGDSRSRSDRPLRAVATVGMITDIVRQVGGERIEVTGLMGPGVDPHLYKASEGDVRRLQEADVVFYNGLHLEAKMAEILERMNRRTRTVAVTRDIPRERLLSPPRFPNAHDPHVWFDVSLWMEAVRCVQATLVELDPAHAAGYEARAGRYLGELRALDQEVREKMAHIPAGRRVLITAHDAFNYFGRAYGVEVRGLQGISTASEAGTADVQDLAGFIAEREIPAVFVESSVPPRAIEAVQAAVRAKGHEVAIGGELFSDAMGNPGTPEGSYIGMVRHNADTIATALRANRTGHEP
jgi:manganese/zinc/iron transport system substrate-binding protein